MKPESGAGSGRERGLCSGLPASVSTAVKQKAGLVTARDPSSSTFIKDCASPFVPIATGMRAFGKGTF